MISEQDKALLDDLCARNGADWVAHYLGQPHESKVNPPINRFWRAFHVAFQLMQEPEGTTVQIVRPL
jgi:hypothetical protein